MKNIKLGAFVILGIIISIVIANLAGYVSPETTDTLVSFFGGNLTALVIVLISNQLRSLKNKKRALKNDKIQ